jgi:signal transduction histidine kinase
VPDDQAQKMAIVGRLTGGVVQDFKNLLTVIMGAIEVLGEAVADRPELSAIAELITEAAARGADLTSHLLAPSRAASRRSLVRSTSMRCWPRRPACFGRRSVSRSRSTSSWQAALRPPGSMPAS